MRTFDPVDASLSHHRGNRAVDELVMAIIEKPLPKASGADKAFMIGGFSIPGVGYGLGVSRCLIGTKILRPCDIINTISQGLSLKKTTFQKQREDR